MSINRVNITGNLTRDPELRATAGGTQVLSFGVAVNDRRRNAQTGEWEDYPNFVDCTMFGTRAEAVSRFLAKGNKVAIEGKLRYSSWERDGQRRSKLEVIVDEIKGKGGEGDVVEVAQGYAENFLFPKKLAVAATKGNLKQLDERRNNIAKREAVRLATANETKAAFEGKTVTVDVKVGDEGILFGSVTAAMIADAIKAQLGMDIDRKRVELGKPIKVAGAHTVAISLYREIKAEGVVLVGVTAEELAAEAEVEEAAEVAEAETAEVETEAAAE